MEINVYMKNGLKFELDYPRRKNVGTMNEMKFEDDKEMIQAFENDAEALELMERMMLHAEFITLDNLKKDVTIRMSEIAAYEVIR